jgi:hypothetical protein
MLLAYFDVSCGGTLPGATRFRSSTRFLLLLFVLPVRVFEELTRVHRRIDGYLRRILVEQIFVRHLLDRAVIVGRRGQARREVSWVDKSWWGVFVK